MERTKISATFHFEKTIEETGHQWWLIDDIF